MGWRNSLGTPGGLGHFLLGLIMVCIGGYLIANQVLVTGAYWSFYGPSTFGITLIPLLFGVGLLFWNGPGIPSLNDLMGLRVARLSPTEIALSGALVIAVTGIVFWLLELRESWLAYRHQHTADDE